MTTEKKLRVAALVDLPRSELSGGHVKGWERLAQASLEGDLPLDLTIYFSGPYKTEDLGPHTHYRHLPPVFSTARLKFLPYVPDHTDLAPYHFALARELRTFDVIHTTDGFFAFAKTAEHVSKKYNIPLVTSFHTDTPAYARLFTRRTIESLVGKNNILSRFLINTLKLPEKQEQKMLRRLAKHVSACRHVLCTKEEDRAFCANLIGAENVHFLHVGTNLKQFTPARADRKGIEERYNIPPHHLVILFVGRLDVGKNIYTLIGACEKLAAEGLPLHLVTAGMGPAADDLKTRLGKNVSVLGFVEPNDLARLYASVDLMVLPSEVEVRSQVCAESLASGCPVLLSHKNGVAALFGKPAALHEVESGVEAWTKALRHFAVDENFRKDLRADALDYGKTKLASWQGMLSTELLGAWQAAFQNKRGQ